MHTETHMNLEAAMDLADHASPAPWSASLALKAMRAEIERLNATRERQILGACDYVPGELDRSAPERIWLQIDTDGDNNDRGERWPGAFDVTWYDEPIGGLEIQYVRADLAVPFAEHVMVQDGWKESGEAALSHISNALEDLETSPDQRPVGLLREAMHCVSAMLSATREASKRG